MCGSKCTPLISFQFSVGRISYVGRDRCQLCWRHQCFDVRSDFLQFLGRQNMPVTCRGFCTFLMSFLLSYTAGARWCFPRKNPLGNTSCDFQRIFLEKTQKVFLKEKSEKHMTCFSDFSNGYFSCFFQDFSLRNMQETRE